MVMELLEDGRYDGDGDGGTVTKCILARVLIFSNIDVVELHSSQTQNICWIDDGGGMQNISTGQLQEVRIVLMLM